MDEKKSKKRAPKAGTGKKKKPKKKPTKKASTKKTTKKTKKPKDKDDPLAMERNTVIRAEELVLGKEIASGNYGTIFKGKCRGHVVAIKVLHNQHLTEKKLEELKNEVDIMRRLQHPVISLMMGLCLEKNNVAIVMEFIEGRNLASVIRDAAVPISSVLGLKLARNMAVGMNWLHCSDPPIIHRDLKPENVMVTKDFEVKICDFGLSAIKEKWDPNAPRKKTAVGTPVYMAPEILVGIPASEKSDVYAYALILWELFVREGRPFDQYTSFEKFCDDLLDFKKRPDLPETVPVSVRGLLKKCWKQKRAKRPSFAEIVDLIDVCLTDLVIMDDWGREIWSSFKEDESVEIQYPFDVTWDTFKEVVSPQISNLDISRASFCLEKFLTSERQDLTSARTHSCVNIEKWGTLFRVFGSGLTAVEKLVQVCDEGYFHGEIDSNEAKKRLNGEPVGSFLIRMSSTGQGLAISKVSENGVLHQRIGFTENDYTISINGDVNTFPKDLPMMLQKLEDDLCLKTPCSTDSIFCENSSEGGAAVYVADAQDFSAQLKAFENK